MNSRSKSRAGFSLVEVVIALGVVAFCFIPVAGLLLLGSHSTQNSVQQTAAVGIASEVAADLQAANSSGVVSFQTDVSGTPYTITLPAAGAKTATAPVSIYMDENGNATAALTSASRYLVSLGFTPPALGHSATWVRILVTWPAQAPNTAGAWPTNFAGSWETATSLDRN